MDLTHKLAISYYKTIAVINEPHKIYLVQHQESNKIYVKKILDVYNINVYSELYQNPIIGTPKIIDYCEEDEQLIVIEEYISGDSLQDKMKNADLSSEDILHYMLDLCAVLAQLHSVKPAIIHRDIKPSNVIITNYNRAVLLDFNAAKYYSSQESEDTVLLGTHGYAAPEQYGFGSSSPQTDIYSLGILLKEMCSCVNDTADCFEYVINKCTQMNRAERFQNIGELKNVLSGPNRSTPCEVPEKHKAGLLPPGFRTRTPWKMLAATVGYLTIFVLSFSLQVENKSGPALWLERIFAFAVALFLVFSCFNYLDVQRLMPLCKHPNKKMRYWGIAILNIAVIFILLTVFYLIDAICFPT